MSMTEVSRMEPRDISNLEERKKNEGSRTRTNGLLVMTKKKRELIPSYGTERGLITKHVHYGSKNPGRL